MTRITEWRPTAVRIGRTKLRWKNDVTENLGKINIQNWSTMAMDREAWKRTVQQTRTHKECSAKKKKDLFND